MHPRDREVLLDALKISDVEERRHVERIHILVTTAIIASYFTPVARELVKTENIGEYTEGLVILSIVYLALRLIDITIPIQQLDQRLATGLRILSPILFLVAVLLYLLLAFITVAGITISTPVAAMLAIMLIGIISAMAFESYRNGPVLGQSVYRSTTSDSGVGRLISGVLLGEYVADHPEEIEEGLQWDQLEERVPGGVTADLKGTDKHGTTVYGEVKHGTVTQQHVGSLLEIFDGISERKLLITNGNVLSKAEETLTEADIEIKQIDYNPEDSA